MEHSTMKLVVLKTSGRERVNWEEAEASFARSHEFSQAQAEVQAEVQTEAQAEAQAEAQNSPQWGGNLVNRMNTRMTNFLIRGEIYRREFQARLSHLVLDERGDVPGWVLVVLMTTGLVTGIWTVAAPRIESLLRGSLDSMNNVR